MQPFSEPSAIGGDRLNPRDIVGQLIIVRPMEYKTGIITQFTLPGTTSDAIACDVVNMDEKDDYAQAGKVYRNVLWFQSKLIQNLRPCIGQLLLGRIGRGAGTPGRTAPYIFESASQDQVAVGRAQSWLATHPEFAAAPVPTPQPPVAPVAQGTPAPGPSPHTVPDPQAQQSLLDRMRQQQPAYPRYGSPPPSDPSHTEAPF